VFRFTPGCCCSTCRVVVEPSPVGIKLTLAGLADNVPADGRWNSKGAAALNAEYVYPDIWTWAFGATAYDCQANATTGVTWGEDTYVPCTEHTATWEWNEAGGIWEIDTDPGSNRCVGECYAVPPQTDGLFDQQEIETPCGGPPHAYEPFVFYGLDEATFAIANWSIALEIGYSTADRRRWITATVGLSTASAGLGEATWTLEESDVSGPFAVLDLVDEPLTIDGDVPEDWPGDWSAVTLQVAGYTPE
jgi:hypothetical protein